MIILYKNEKIEKQYEDFEWLTKEFGKDIAKKYFEFKDNIMLADNIYVVKTRLPGLNVEKLKTPTKSEWSARLNKSYRVNFICKDDYPQYITEITIIRIHNHDY